MEKACIMPPLSMLLTQLIITGMMILAKIDFDRGAFIYAFLAYRSIIAAICVAPFAFIFEREMMNKLSWSAAMWIFVNATTGITIGMGVYYYGLRDTTATFSSCFCNLIPIVTFILSVIVRTLVAVPRKERRQPGKQPQCNTSHKMEKLNMDTSAGQMKVLGAVLSVGGAMIITLYKGKILYSGSGSQHSWEQAATPHHWKRGTFFLIGSCFIDAFWYLGQVKLFTVFPSKYWATTLTCAVGSLQSVLVGVLLNPKKSAWKLGWNLQLLTTVYSGALTTGVLFCFITWVTTVKGPTYPAVFNSLSLIFIAIIETSTMGQQLFVGSLLGIILIIGGLSAILWGKGRESSKREENMPQEV